MSLTSLRNQTATVLSLQLGSNFYTLETNTGLIVLRKYAFVPGKMFYIGTFKMRSKYDYISAIMSPQVRILSASHAKETLFSNLSFIQILELSGIGDPAILTKAGVDVKVDLPGVGNNVQEHLYSGITYRKFNASSSLEYQSIMAHSRSLGLKVHEYEGHQFHTSDPLFNPEEAQHHLALRCVCNPPSLLFCLNYNRISNHPVPQAKDSST